MTDQAAGPGFATLAIHAGAPVAPAFGAASPLDPPAASGFEPIEQTAALFGLESFDHDFSRSITSVNAVLEERMAALEGGSAALAVASGQAAQFLAFHMLLAQGDELIAGGKPHGGPRHQIGEAYTSFGWTVRWADPANPASFERALSPRTRAIFVESFADSGASVVDIAAIAAIAKRARVPLIVDNTLATPYLMRPIEHGADIIIHSAMKFLGGHETLTGGLIVDAGSFPWQDDPRFPILSQPQPDYGGIVFAERFGNFAFASACRLLGLKELGPTLSPFNAFLIPTGLETLALRMERHSENALHVAEYLAQHKAVRGVNYPGLPSDPAHALAKIYCPRGAGAILTCRLAGGYHAARAFIQSLRLFSPLDDVGDARSRARHPASTTHRHLSDVEKVEAGAEPDLIRLSIGLEDLGDIIADLDQALAAT